MKLSHEVNSWFRDYFRCANYLAAAMLYLKDNFLLKEALKPEHIKDRILGHWGTVPGLNFAYLHLNYLISKHRLNMFLVVGPGHGAPAILANLFLEGTLHEYYPQYSRDEKGIAELIKKFSWPGGFPSHLNPGTPGSILEGGELGYSLSTAYGAVFDNPDLLVACIVGDGEAESGPLAASWNSNKFLNPKTSGAVLPILHVNGYKISTPTVYGTMSDKELDALFTGFGYEPRFVETHLHEQMEETLEWAYHRIGEIQKKARGGEKFVSPKWPMIVMRTQKGWTGIKRLDGEQVAGSFHSHGIPMADPKTNPSHLKILENWLSSYQINELLDEKGAPKKEVLKYVPSGNLRMGMNPHANGGTMRQPLKLPAASDYELRKEIRGNGVASNTGTGGKFLRDVFVLNKKEQNFRFFCPDETESNKLNAVFDVTGRAYMWPLKSTDEHMTQDGRVMEILSEHTLQGWLQGYLLTGRHGLFATYEAFATIVSSMVDQFAKFIKQSLKFPWRKPVSSLNYILTSVGWRQEHNGFSHQNPSFISGVLAKHGKFSSVYFPADANTLLAVLEDCLQRTNAINVIAVDKQMMSQWISLKEAREQVKTGVGLWDWINPAHAKNPDVVLAAAGDHMTEEAMAAVDLLRTLAPSLKIRFVNVTELTSLGIGDEKHPLQMGTKTFEHFFTKDRPIVFNYHGYTGDVKKLLWNHPVSQRISVHGYEEEGTTTTPFHMMVMNKTSRWHLCMDLIEKASARNRQVRKVKSKLLIHFEKKLAEHERYITENGMDMPEIRNWHWSGTKN